MTKFVGTSLEWDGQLHPDAEFDNGNSGAGTVTLDFAKGNRQKITMTGNCLFGSPSNLKIAATYLLRLIGDGSALRTPTWNSIFEWIGGTAPVLSGASSQDLFAFYYTGSKLLGSPNVVNGCLIGCTVLTSGTTFTTNARTKKIRVQLIGGGGGGGGTTGSTNNAAAGGGGGSGSYAEKLFDVTPSTSYTYAIGGAGTAGANTGGTGGNGGNSTFTVGATTVTANGGLGGVGMTTASTALFALGGNGGAVSTNGDLNAAGQAGFWGFRVSGTVAAGGVGAPSFFGGGGSARNTAGAGSNAGNYGAGGGGACSIGNNNAAGGSGSQGVIIVWEFS